MIIDNVALNGRDAYLFDRATGGPIDLAQPPHRGQTPRLRDGQVLETTSVDLNIHCTDLDTHLTPTDKPLIQFSIRKELFPGLFLDPFHVRTHNIAGLQDFREGELTAMRAQLVEGIPTLVSEGAPGVLARWVSPLYRLSGPMRFTSAAWELATSRLTPKNAFVYSIRLVWWSEGSDPDDPAAAQTSVLADGFNPTDPTHAATIPGPSPANVIAYRLEFDAKVEHDSAINEFQIGDLEAGSLGRPLLRAINLLEAVDPGNEFASLYELMTDSEDFAVFPENSGPRQRLFVTVPLSASLKEDEYIAINLSDEFAADLIHMTARVRARLFVRPADAKRPGG